MTRSGARAIGLLLTAAAAAGWPVEAQPVGVRFTSEFDPLNFAHASFLGSGYYSIDGRQIYIVRIKTGWTLRSTEDGSRRLRLTLRPTIGFFDFRPRDVVAFGLPESLGSVSVLPGLELRVPVTHNWRIDPFVEAGPAVELEDDTVTWVVGAGARSRAEFPLAEHRFVLWNTLLWAGNRESRVAPRDDFVVFETMLEWRHRLPATVFGQPTEIGPLLKAELYVDALRIRPPRGQGIDIDERFEVGLTWGPRERVMKWRLPVPRVGVSYRFGNGATAWRLILTSRF